MRALKWRALFALWMLVLAGPTPGSLGSCGDQVEYVEAEALCRDTEALRCQRAYERGLRGIDPLVSDDQLAACRSEATERCDAASLPAGCAVTVRARDRCVGALSSVERLSEPSDAIEECQPEALCGPDFAEDE